MRTILSLLFLLIGAVLSGCSFTSTTGSINGKDGHDLRLIALLPPKIDGDISRERVQLVQKLVRAQLEGKGFLLVEDRAVNSVCPDSTCPRKAELVSRYGVQALVENEVNSVARANFLAGYVNSVSGTLRFYDPAGTELFTVSHTKRERGGLLFNTGQIAQAVIQTASNAKSDESFSILAGLYAKDLVDEVPAPVVAAQSKVDTGVRLRAEILSTQVVTDKDGADRICMKGTPASFGSLVYHRTKTGLREVSPGEYCGLFHLADFPEKASLAVELSTPYGGLAREQLTVSRPESCELTGAVKLQQEGRRVKLTVACDLNGYKKFLVYRSAGDTPVFQKVGEIKGDTWAENSPGGVTYAVVAVSKSGELTSPIVLSAERTSTQS